MANPQFPVSAQMAAPTPISVLCSGYGEPPRGTGGGQASEPGVFCPSAPGCPCKDFYPGRFKRELAKDPGRQGLHITERTAWESP